MILYFDLDTQKLVKPAGESGLISSLSLIRGDFTPLKVHFLKDAADVTDVTNIVAVIKEAPGPTAISLADCQSWTLADTAFTGTLDLNGNALDTLLGSQTFLPLHFEITCHQAGLGPITSHAVLCTLSNDYWRGDEASPTLEATPDDNWVAHGHAQSLTAGQQAQARENIGIAAPLALSAPPTNGVRQVKTFAFDGTATVDGGYTMALTSADLMGSPRNYTYEGSIGQPAYIFSSNFAALLAADPDVAAILDVTVDGFTITITRIAPGDDATLDLQIVADTAPGSDLTYPANATTVATGGEGSVGSLGQLAIVTAEGGSTSPTIERDVFTCVSLVPFLWSPPGNLFQDPDSGLWYRHAILAGGGGAIDFGLAYT